MKEALDRSWDGSAEVVAREGLVDPPLPGQVTAPGD